MLMSVCFIECYFYSCLWHVSGIARCLIFSHTCLCNSAHRKLRCVGILICTCQLVNDVRVRRCNACFRICSLHSIALGQSSTSGTRLRVPYSFGWITSSGTRDCFSWHWILWRLLLLKPMLNAVW